ncbi:MAG: hypothetical protein J5I93_27775 [Pirellulaceae bacterium]|nr:hypothetical protein [Pirellulaceae bacterium]
MPGQPRHKIVRNGEIATYHCWSRCVQRAFLCGQDSYTGDDYRRLFRDGKRRRRSRRAAKPQ